MKYFLEEQIGLINKRFDMLYELLAQWHSDNRAGNANQTQIYLRKAESIDLSALFRYLAKKVESMGFPQVQYHLFLRNPTSIDQQHTIFLFLILRKICLQILGDIFAEKVVIELTEYQNSSCLEINYQQVASNEVEKLRFSLAEAKKYTILESGEMTASYAGNNLYLKIERQI